MTASEDLTARVWDLESRRVLHVLPHGSGDDAWVESARFSRDGQQCLQRATTGRPSSGAPPRGPPVATLGEKGGPALSTLRSRRTAGSSPPPGFTRRSSSGVAQAETDSAAGPVLEGRRRGVRPRRRPSRGRWRRHAPRLARRRWGAGRVGLDGRGRQFALTSVAFDPGGTRVAAGSSSGAIWLWDRRDGSGWRAGAQRRRRHRRLVRRWRSLPRRGARAQGTANVWSVPRGQLVTTLRTRASSLEGAAFAPSGRRVAVAGAGGRVAVFDARSAARCARSCASRRNASRQPVRGA